MTEDEIIGRLEMRIAFVGPGAVEDIEDALRVLKAWKQRVANAEAEVTYLQAAIKPFADAAGELEDDDHGSIWEHPAAMCITANDLRNCQRLRDTSRSLRAYLEKKND